MGGLSDFLMGAAIEGGNFALDTAARAEEERLRIEAERRQEEADIRAEKRRTLDNIAAEKRAIDNIGPTYAATRAAEEPYIADDDARALENEKAAQELRDKLVLKRRQDEADQDLANARDPERRAVMLQNTKDENAAQSEGDQLGRQRVWGDAARPNNLNRGPSMTSAEIVKNLMGTVPQPEKVAEGRVPPADNIREFFAYSQKDQAGRTSLAEAIMTDDPTELGQAWTSSEMPQEVLANDTFHSILQAERSRFTQKDPNAPMDAVDVNSAATDMLGRAADARDTVINVLKSWTQDAEMSQKFQEKIQQDLAKPGASPKQVRDQYIDYVFNKGFVPALGLKLYNADGTPNAKLIDMRARQAFTPYKSLLTVYLDRAMGLEE